MLTQSYVCDKKLIFIWTFFCCAFSSVQSIDSNKQLAIDMLLGLRGSDRAAEINRNNLKVYIWNDLKPIEQDVLCDIFFPPHLFISRTK